MLVSNVTSLKSLTWKQFCLKNSNFFLNTLHKRFMSRNNVSYSAMNGVLHIWCYKSRHYCRTDIFQKQRDIYKGNGSSTCNTQSIDRIAPLVAIVSVFTGVQWRNTRCAILKFSALKLRIPEVTWSRLNLNKVTNFTLPLSK